MGKEGKDDMRVFIAKADVLAKLERYCESISCEMDCDSCELDYAKNVIESMDEYVLDDVKELSE